MPDVTVKTIDSLPTLSGVSSGDKLVVQHGNSAYQADASLFKGDKGDNGAAGANGAPGVNGVSPTVTTSKSGKVTTLTITDVNGTRSTTISDGQDGTVSFDNLTPEQKASLKGDPGEGVPTGGTLGQILLKASATDYDTNWGDIPIATPLTVGGVQPAAKTSAMTQSVGIDANGELWTAPGGGGGGGGSLPSVSAADNGAILQVVSGAWAKGYKIWVGAEADYTAITTKDANTLYFIILAS